MSWSPFHGSQGTAVGHRYTSEGGSEAAYVAQIGPWEGVDTLSPATVSVLTPVMDSSLYSTPFIQLLVAAAISWNKYLIIRIKIAICWILP